MLVRRISNGLIQLEYVSEPPDICEYISSLDTYMARKTYLTLVITSENGSGGFNIIGSLNVTRTARMLQL